MAAPVVAVAAGPPPSGYRQVFSRYFNAPAHGRASCLAGVRGYAVVRGYAASAPPAAEHPAVATAGCPLKTVVLAGGAGTDAASTGVVLAAESPTRDGHGRRAFYNNRSRVTVPVAAYALCGRPWPGYTVVTGPPASVRPHRTATAVAVCAPGVVVLGSGGFPVAGPSSRVDVNTVFVEGPPVGEVYLSNRSGTPVDIVAVSICADVG